MRSPVPRRGRLGMNGRQRAWLPGDAARAATLLISLVLAGCSDRSLPPLPEPDLAGFAEAVQEQLRSARASAAASENDADSVGRYGRVLYAYGQHRAAAEAFERCRRLEPEEFDWIYLLGVVRADLGQFEHARALFETAAAIRPADLPTAVRLADLLEQAGESGPGPTNIGRRAIRRSGRCRPPLPAGGGWPAPTQSSQPGTWRRLFGQSRTIAKPCMPWLPLTELLAARPRLPSNSPGTQMPIPRRAAITRTHCSMPWTPSGRAARSKSSIPGTPCRMPGTSRARGRNTRVSWKSTLTTSRLT